MRLKIYDAMWLIHHGSKSERHKDYVFSGYPLGGVRYLVKHIVDDLWRRNHVLVCFDSRTNKSSLLPCYKSNRTHSACIVSQSMFAYNALMKCGVTSLKGPDMEGDDYIASAVTKFRNDYDEIVIVSNDKDTAHNVFSRVRVEACSAGGIDIDADNFSLAAARQPLLYNTLSAYKVLTGDNSDAVPTFKSETGKSGRAIYYDLVAFVHKNVPDTELRPFVISRKDFFEFFLKQLTYLTDADRAELGARIEVMFPRIVDVGEKPGGVDEIDRTELAKLLSVLNDEISLESLKMTRVKLSQDEFNEFKMSAQVLRDGTFAVDNDCPVGESPSWIGQDLNLRLFE